MKIFLADDSKMMRDEIIDCLHKMELRDIIIAENGKEAVEVLKGAVKNGESSIDLILLDINMPGFTGIQVLKILKTMSAYANTSILMISTESEKEIVVESIISGATDYILKPFEFETFKEKVSKYLL